MAIKYPFNKNLYVFAFLAIIFLMHILGFLKPTEAKIRLIISPLLAKIYQSSDPTLFKISKQELYGQYQQCLAVLNESDYFRAQTEILKDENEKLRVALKFAQSAPYTLINAQVIGRGLDLSEQTILINVGKNSDLKLNLPVIVGSGQLIGKIVGLDAQSAWVRLLSDSQSKVASMILNEDKSGGVVEGGYGLSIKMDFIPRNDIVAIGDLVITSGLETDLPKGLLIGTIAALENEAYKPFQQALITPVGNFDKIDIVSVIIN